MKSILLALFVSLCIASAASPALAAQHTATFSYKLPELGNSPACSATVSTDCVVGANLYQVAGAALTQLNLIPVPVAAGSTASTVQQASLPWNHLGTATASATCVIKNSTGGQEESAQSASTTFQVKAVPPGNLVVDTQ